MMRETIYGVGMVIALTLTSVNAGNAHATYPERPITLLIGYSAGGGTDTLGRVIAKILSKELGQQINVVNKPGAGGGIAAMTLRAAKANGYTLLLNPSTTITVSPQIAKQLTYKVDDFTYIAMATSFQAAWVAPIGRPYNSLAEFVTYAKANPGATYATLNPISKMVMDTLAKKESLKINYVPVKGGAGMVTAVLGKRVDLAFSGGIHQRHPEEIKLISALTSKRHQSSPDVATATESGYDITFNALTTLIAPKGIAAEIVAKIEAAMKNASTHPDLVSIAAKAKFPIDFKNSVDATAEMKTQWKNFAALRNSTKK